MDTDLVGSRFRTIRLKVRDLHIADNDIVRLESISESLFSVVLLGLGKLTPFYQKLLQTPTDKLAQLYQNDQPFKHFVLFSVRVHLDRHELRQSQGCPDEERS